MSVIFYGPVKWVRVDWGGSQMAFIVGKEDPLTQKNVTGILVNADGVAVFVDGSGVPAVVLPMHRLIAWGWKLAGDSEVEREETPPGTVDWFDGQ